MKKILLLLPLIFFSCTPSEDNTVTQKPTPETSNFNFTLTPSATDLVIDQYISIVLTSTEDIKSFETSTNNFATSGVLFSGSFGTTKEFFFKFDDLGTKTISIRVKNIYNEVITKTVTVNVTRGTAVKINKMQVVSFKDINNTWDPEFPSTDPDRLADVYFGFSKPKLDGLFSNMLTMNLWYVSVVKENQGDLIWDMSSENLYINPDFIFRFALVEKDGQLAQNLMMGFPDYRTLRLSDYLETKPNTITYSDPTIDLEIILTVEWP